MLREMRRIPSRENISEIGVAFRDTYVSRQWVRASTPEAAVCYRRQAQRELRVENRHVRDDVRADDGLFDLLLLDGEDGVGRGLRSGSGGRGDHDGGRPGLRDKVDPQVVADLPVVGEEDAHRLGDVEGASAADPHNQVELLFPIDVEALLERLDGGLGRHVVIHLDFRAGRAQGLKGVIQKTRLADPLVGDHQGVLRAEGPAFFLQLRGAAGPEEDPVGKPHADNFHHSGSFAS